MAATLKDVNQEIPCNLHSNIVNPLIHMVGGMVAMRRSCSMAMQLTPMLLLALCLFTGSTRWVRRGSHPKRIGMREVTLDVHSYVKTGGHSVLLPQPTRALGDGQQICKRHGRPG